MAKRQYNQAKKLTPTELLYSFAGWLTTRKQPIVMGANYDASAVGRLISAFIDVNKLPGPRDHYPTAKKPTNLDDLTNNYPVNAVAQPPLTPDEAVWLFASKLSEMSRDDQDVTLASLLDQLRKERTRRLHNTERQKRASDEAYDEMQESLWNLEKIARGDFYVIKPGGAFTLKTQNKQ